MSKLISPLISTSPSALLRQGKLHLAVQLDRDIIHQLIAWSAVYVHGPTTVIDCGCAFNATRTLELIHLEQVYFKQAMNSIQVSRPFTAYQFKSSTSSLLKHPPPSDAPIIVMGALKLLYDDNLRLGEAMRLLNNLLQDFQQLCQHHPIVLTVSPPPKEMQPRLCLLHKLLDQADHTVTVDSPAEADPAQQLTLF